MSENMENIQREMKIYATLNFLQKFSPFILFYLSFLLIQLISSECRYDLYCKYVVFHIIMGLFMVISSQSWMVFIYMQDLRCCCLCFKAFRLNLVNLASII